MSGGFGLKVCHYLGGEIWKLKKKKKDWKPLEIAKYPSICHSLRVFNAKTTGGSIQSGNLVIVL